MNTSNQTLLDVLTREGVLINVSIRYWRGCKKLQAEDIGLDSTAVSDRLISLGQKRLLPRDATAELTLIESRAHALVEGNTFPFLNGLGHFLPNTRLEDVSGKLRELETGFWEAKENFVRSYASHREAALAEWRQMAGRLVTDPARLLCTIEGAFPVSVEKHYGFDVQLFQIAVPDHLGVELVTVGDQQRIIEARQQASFEAADRIRTGTEQFVSECVASLRQQTAQLCEEMLASINVGKTEGVHQKTLNRLIRFIDQFRQLNFANDTAMEQQLEQVRSELLNRTAVEYRDSAFAQRQLVSGLSALAGKARELASADATAVVARFGQMGVRKFNLAA